MSQLQPRHISLFRVLRDYCSFLTRSQIQRIFALPTNKTNKELLWLTQKRYLRRRYRVDSFRNFQTPVYYLGELGWHVAGKPQDQYKNYRVHMEQRSERGMNHALAIHDVILKFVLESNVKRLVHSEDSLWQEAIDLGNIPDAWIQFERGEAFVEVDLDTERPSVLKKKFENYLNYEESGAFDQLFPGCQFRVLVFTPSEERIEELERIVPSDDIWFCVKDEFLREKLSHEHWFAFEGFYALPVAPKEKM